MNYEKALDLMTNGNYEQAVTYLKMSIADHPMSSGATAEKGEKEYFPYLQLGISYYHLGKSHLASDYFDLESSFPAIQASRQGQQLLNEYRRKLERTTDLQVALGTIRKFERKPYLLSNEEVKELKEEVRHKCNLPAVHESAYPWYFHYELGLRFANKNDWQRALDSFLEALDHNERPEKFTRLYGMWFIDYYPYFNIGMAHYRLKNWKCAATSFRLSSMIEDISKDTSEYSQREKLEQESDDRIKN